ncbi:MAG: carbamoyl-phosphate synthase large subunit, partial [Pseudonocardiales bacterium]|nr:carbamoyl-phosphate synthase large subunit [Pseudonocardiales bacterium]
MNVLVTCAGRRNHLVRCFRSALGTDGLVIAADASSDAPALREADRAHVVPAVNAPTGVDALLGICHDEDVRLLVSLNDFELPFLADRREDFAAVGTTLAVSSREVVDICFDKWETVRFLQSCGLSAPMTYLSLDEVATATDRHDLAFPLVVKPRWGTASIAVEVADGIDELRLLYDHVAKKVHRSALASPSSQDPGRCVIVQELLPGQEYGMDVVNDLEGRYVATLGRRKISMRSGETDKAI